MAASSGPAPEAGGVAGRGGGTLSACTSKRSAVAVAASAEAPCACVFSTSTATLASAAAAAMSAAGGGGTGGGPGNGATVGGGPGGAGGGGGGTGNGAEIILAQAAVIAAALIMPAPCCRLTALCIAMPSVSSITASSMPSACAGA